MNIRALLRGIIYGHKADSQRYIAHLRKIGVHVGENVTIYTPSKTTIDECYPWLTTTGNNVKITQGVIILNHDYAWSVLHNKMKNCGNYEASVQFLANNKPLFMSFDAFLEHYFLDKVT